MQEFFQKIEVNNEYLQILIIVAALTVLITVVVLIAKPSARKKNRKLRRRLNSNVPIRSDLFESRWIVSDDARNTDAKKCSGFKYIDTSGCYIITVYEAELKNPADYYRYDEVYIGQSLKICQRVHSHFSGRGSGNIYADIREGLFVYVKFIPCPPENMNELEKKLIDEFQATESYNITRGGGANRPN